MKNQTLDKKLTFCMTAISNEKQAANQNRENGLKFIFDNRNQRVFVAKFSLRKLRKNFEVPTHENNY